MGDGFTFMSAIVAGVTALYIARMGINFKVLNTQRETLLEQYRKSDAKMDRLVAPLVAHKKHIHLFNVVPQGETAEALQTHDRLWINIRHNLYLGSQELQDKVKRYLEVYDILCEIQTRDHPKNFGSYSKDQRESQATYQIKFQNMRNELKKSIDDENENLLREREKIVERLAEIDAQIEQFRDIGICHMYNYYKCGLCRYFRSLMIKLKSLPNYIWKVIRVNFTK
jgi:hypothetical protein